jgi:hypothetical protein
MKPKNKNYSLKQPQVEPHERKELEWWLRHHKANVKYFCIRIANMLEARNNGETETFEWHLSHFKAVLPAFAEGVQFDLGWDESEEDE